MPDWRGRSVPNCQMGPRTTARKGIDTLRLGAMWLAMTFGGCGGANNTGSAVGVTAETHGWFPIMTGASHAIGLPITKGTIACTSCHASTATSLKDFTCVGCHGHEQSVTDLLHLSVPQYAYASAQCLSCHPSGQKVAYDHANVTNNCALCHDVGAQFAALPVTGFTHPPTGGADCGGCHTTSAWTGATGAPPDGVGDPHADLVLTALIPTYVGMAMSNMSPLTETLPMPMNHTSTEVLAAAFSVCTNCHQDAATGVYYPGNLHSSLANLALVDPTIVEPTACASCHLNSMPVGFVGPIAANPARTPASGEMKHDAVVWANDAPTAVSIVPTNCGTCHASPSATLQATWATNLAGTSPAQFHPALSAAGLSQPTSCIDCHANSRPEGLLDSMNSTVPAGLQFDHSSPSAQADCASCHAASSITGWTSWSMGQFHAPGAATPSTCLPCHAGERPTSTAGWTSTTYKNSPFDYVTSAVRITHGDGQDCATCHTGPGNGAWGGTENWSAGHFTHGPATVAGMTCIACHSAQRPDLQPGTTAAAAATLVGFDHSQNGTGDCFGCHQATVTAGTYVNYFNTSTQKLPNGDWKGGQSYPGSSFVSSADQFVTVTETTLNRSGANNLITSTSSIGATLYNGMLHISTVLPAALAAGPSTMPDNTKCWHCHTNTNGTVTAYKGGQFHSSLTNYRATPTSAVAALPQPTSQCADCHSPMLPTGIVEKGGSDLQPMDHGMSFTSAVTIGGVSVTKVSQMDCSTCHKSPGSTWSDGVFHANIGAATPKDCVSCHYVAMADATKADVNSGTNFTMKHGSTQLTFQTCQTCHPSAFAKGSSTPIAATLWQTGAFHGSVATQPSACIDCHSVSEPAAGAATQSAISYTLSSGGTSSNTGQWMNHGSGQVGGKDCVACHAADAKATGSAWSKADSFHAIVTKASTCQECHGLTNGGGSVAGTKNNLPSGLTSSTMATSAATGSSTGIPAGTLAQISHADVNVTGHDCGFCHTQAGVSTMAGIQGKEWAQAQFHANFTSSGNPLVVNGTTGRCSNCHMNVKPGAAFTAQDHSSFTNASGSTDCSSCHSVPGTGTVSAPNWLGVAGGGVPATIPVGGFTISQPPATSATTQKGITSLPHPTVGTGVTCATCHTGGAGGVGAIGYDHTSSLINSNCNSCHEAGSNLVGTKWNGATAQGSGAGDTRPYTIASLVVSKSGSHTVSNSYSHFYPVDCRECHSVPSGNGLTTTGSAYTSAWSFPHKESNMTNSSTCNMCHGSPNNVPK
jgi:Cytochrome c7 and related cytochrome c